MSRVSGLQLAAKDLGLFESRAVLVPTLAASDARTQVREDKPAACGRRPFPAAAQDYRSVMSALLSGRRRVPAVGARGLRALRFAWAADCSALCAGRRSQRNGLSRARAPATGPAVARERSYPNSGRQNRERRRAVGRSSWRILGQLAVISHIKRAEAANRAAQPPAIAAPVGASFESSRIVSAVCSMA